MGKLKVLITNRSLSDRTGAELYVLELARGLLAAGHSPVLYSPRPGALAELIRRETVPVVDDLDKLTTAPDIIHGQHADETATALLRFPRAPALYVCHDWYLRVDAPPRFPRVLRCVGVDSACRDKLVFEHGFPEERVSVLLQFVDLEKFRPRRGPLPPKPKRALILCNQTRENEFLDAARAACSRAGVALDVYGMGVGRPHARPEELMAEYDVVFAKGRTALEAAAVGAAVVVYWWRRLGPLVTTDAVEQMRRDNFGMRSMGPRMAPAEFGREVEAALARYDAADAARVCERVRAGAGRERLIEEFVALYGSVIEEHSASPARDEEAEGRAAASYLRSLSLTTAKEYEALHGSALFRLRERLLGMPLVAGASRALARAAHGARRKP